METASLRQKLRRFFFGEDCANSIYDSLPMQGEAIVVSDIEPSQEGRVKFHSTYWFGRCVDHSILRKGEVVQVLGREANTLIVGSKQTKRFARVPKPPVSFPAAEATSPANAHGAALRTESPSTRLQSHQITQPVISPKASSSGAPEPPPATRSSDTNPPKASPSLVKRSPLLSTLPDHQRLENQRLENQRKEHEMARDRN